MLKTSDDEKQFIEDQNSLSTLIIKICSEATDRNIYNSLGALGQAIVAIIYHNSKNHKEGVVKLRRFYAGLEQVLIDLYSDNLGITYLDMDISESEEDDD